MHIIFASNYLNHHQLPFSCAMEKMVDSYHFIATTPVPKARQKLGYADANHQYDFVVRTCGSVVACDDIDAMEREIIRICEEKPYSAEACLKRAKLFDMQNRFQEYMKLYEETYEQQSH